MSDFFSSGSDSDSREYSHDRGLFGKHKNGKNNYQQRFEHMRNSMFSHMQSYAASHGYGTPSNPYGDRLSLDSYSSFPDPYHTHAPPCYDADSVSPIFIGSAIFDNSIQPCKIGRHLNPVVSVPYGGMEYGHYGRYDLLPFIPERMEFVRTSHGHIPHGRHPIEGGHEDHGAKLYHAVGTVYGIRVPGKTGKHLGGCNVSFGGVEHVIQENYDILCWKYTGETQ